MSSDAQHRIEKHSILARQTTHYDIVHQILNFDSNAFALIFLQTSSDDQLLHDTKMIRIHFKKLFFLFLQNVRVFSISFKNLSIKYLNFFYIFHDKKIKKYLFDHKFVLSIYLTAYTY